MYWAFDIFYLINKQKRVENTACIVSDNCDTKKGISNDSIVASTRWASHILYLALESIEKTIFIGKLHYQKKWKDLKQRTVCKA